MSPIKYVCAKGVTCANEREVEESEKDDHIVIYN